MIGVLARSLLATSTLLCASSAFADDDDDDDDDGGSAYEVWLVDQSDSVGVPYGGRIYIYDGADVDAAATAGLQPSQVIDIAAETAALCMASTGANPVRPHMLLFNGTESHAVLAFVASGHVVIYDADTRAPLSCIRTSVGTNGLRQAHAAFPSADGTYILVANQNGKLLERIDTNYATNTFTLNNAAKLNLATCTTPNGVPCEAAGVRPDNAPICPIIDRTSNYGFVTLRGGGLFVVNPRTTPMRIVGEYDMTRVAGNGCGGVDTRTAMFMNSGGGTANNLDQFDVYRFPVTGYRTSNRPNTPAVQRIYTDASVDRDAHGMVLVDDEKRLWVADRNQGVIEVFDTKTNAHLSTIDLVTSTVEDPSPDLLDISPDGERIVVSTRGPNPLSGDPHASTGSDPGMMVLDPEDHGEEALIEAHVAISNIDATNIQRADTHGIRIRTLPCDDDDDCEDDD